MCLTCLISHNDQGGFELDVTIVEMGMAPFQHMMDNMALIKGNVALMKDSMAQRPTGKAR